MTMSPHDLELPKPASKLCALDCRRFLPELILCGTIVLLLLLRLFVHFDRLAPRLDRPGH